MFETFREAYTEAALEELLEIEAYLEAQSSGLGKTFRSEFSATVDLLLEFPEAAPVVSPRGIRRRLLPRFPYAILYVLTKDLLLILAVAHTSRAPDYGKDRF
ncbi:type II toxin-antitoxin system RelE/ParE family toxin [Truepera radiovictrix]|uniref:Plasmid stabilization system n=1 Tax=Truepera radiovictrix (strain DSM 17093 / CIP 108686 / LMG 22925 / RQ-24) TaxID=649638 RepID=D7CY42_TRURR|nr:type II toxin-antitoxin system RelE/ParE family toxin [Truepera radiovictrix]ADI13402.1 plasmid stabilization system [Truepera radiovictrix DSM 17093]WMT58035.1 type II toxin-antitoxin system RelE/ParE family toxin [Truepera radiovictrix]